jgi:hypothetical protein
MTRCLEHGGPACAQADFRTNTAEVLWGINLPEGPDGRIENPPNNWTTHVQAASPLHLALYNVKTADSPGGSLLISDRYSNCIRRLHLDKPPLNASDHRRLETFYGTCGSSPSGSTALPVPGSIAVDGTQAAPLMPQHTR